MFGSIFSKALWLGRATSAVVGLTVIGALLLGVAASALGATGANFVLGKANGATTISKLTANVAGPALNLVNTGTGAAATALNLKVAAGHPPLSVNSSTKVANLNADQLDGKSEADFYAAGSKVIDSSHADSADHAETATTAASATNAEQADSAISATNSRNAEDADLLDGKDSSAFLGADGKAQDSAHADDADHASTADSAAVSGYEHAFAQSAFNSTNRKGAFAQCPEGKRVIGGGAMISSDTTNAPITIQVSRPDFLSEGGLQDEWTVIAEETSPYDQEWLVRAYAICVKATN